MQLRAFLRDETGQDVIEFALLLAFVVLVSAALFVDLGQSSDVIWAAASNYLSRGADTVK